MDEKPSGLDRINAAAVRLIGLRGFAEATTQGIAKAAKVSEGLIYRYYDTKPKLGLGLFRRHYQEVLARLKAARQAHDDPVDGLRAVAMAFFTWYDENPDVARFLLKTHSEFLQQADDGQELMKLVGDGMKEVLGEDLFALFPSDLLSAMVLGAFLQVAVECMHGQIEGPLAPRMEPIIDAMAAYVQEALGPETTQSESGGDGQAEARSAEQ
ncbi:MAG: TetR/AcrR family transcriptional regulator [Planctomycetes bacterium]|nr:TetR/AcrR family transcriptional regulator [Planctomycetota bacterium]